MQEYEDKEKEIDLKELFFTYKSKLHVIIICTIAFAVMTGGITKWFISPVYSSTAQLLVVAKDTEEQMMDLSLGTQLAQDYMVMATTKPILKRVIDELDLNISANELKEKITIENPEETRIMQITVEDSNPKRAQKIAQRLSQLIAQTVAKTMDIKAPEIIEQPDEAEVPDSPNMSLNVIVGAAFGFCLSLFVLFIQFMLNDTINKEEDIEKYLGINMLTKLPLQKGEKKRKRRVRKAGNII